MANVLIAARTQTIAGKAYDVGVEVPVDALPTHKVAQLVAQRWLVLIDEDQLSYRVTRECAIDGKRYSRGDTLDPKFSDTIKISQLLEHRVIEPVVEEAAAVRPARKAAAAAVAMKVVAKPAPKSVAAKNKKPK